MIEYKILVPTYDNAKQSTLGARIKFQSFLLEACGGFTCGCEVYGQWRGDDGTLYSDHSIPVYVALADGFDFDFIVRQWFALFADQEALYYTAGRHTFIASRPKNIGWGDTETLGAGRHDKGYRK